MTVVDASVTAKWFLPELDSCEAERLLEGPETMIAPDLIRIEVAAAISRRFRLGDLDAAEAGELCEEWLKAIGEGVVSTVPSRRLEGGQAPRPGRCHAERRGMAYRQDASAHLGKADGFSPIATVRGADQRTLAILLSRL
jgi:hypothetical protein